MCKLRFLKIEQYQHPMRQISLLFILSVFTITQIFSQGFSDQSTASGVGFVHAGQPPEFDMPMGAGTAWFDYDNNGLLDLYIVNRVGANKFFENNGDGTFDEIASTLGIEDASHDGSGVVIGDINNDGYQDLFLANSDENILFLNNQGTSFTDITASSGLAASGPNRSTSGSFGDYNNDGYLDLYITNHVGIVSTGVGAARDYLYLNNGDKTFTDVSYHLNVLLIADPGFASAWTDYDKDGDQDLIVINDCPFDAGGNPNNGTSVFKNGGGTDPILDWKFTESADVLLEDDCANGMGIGIGDYNRDGYMDLVYSDVGPARLFKNNQGVFESQDTAGVSNQPFDHFSWGTSFMDFDNDGWLDIAMAVGALILGEGIDSTQECNFFHNNGDETFTEIANTLGLDDDTRTRSLVHGDYDDDGDLDLIMLNFDGDVRLFRNDEVNSNNYLRIKLRSKKSAPDGIGSWIEVKTNDGVKQYFEMHTGSNLGGGDEILAHFGLGTATSIDSIKVSWMSGEESILTNVSVDTTIIIREPYPYIYVRKGANGDNDGSDWANAYSELTTALTNAVSGDTILVADATYYPTLDLNENLSFDMKDNVHLIGGFPATGGTFLERDLVGLNTILSGFIGENNASNERSYNVIQVSAAVTTCSLNGFSIIEGEADGTDANDKQGGALFCQGQIEMNNIKMENNISSLPGSSICSSGATGNVILKNTQITPPNLSVPVISIDNNSKVHIAESCTIEE